MYKDQWLDIVGKALILLATGVQFFWLSPVVANQQSMEAIRLRGELSNISGEVSVLNTRISSLQVSEALGAEGALNVMNEMLNNMEALVDATQSVEFQGAMENMEETIGGEVAKRTNAFFYLFMIGSLFVVVGEFLRFRRDNAGSTV